MHWKSEVKVQNCNLVVELKLKMMAVAYLNFLILALPSGGTFPFDSTYMFIFLKGTLVSSQVDRKCRKSAHFYSTSLMDLIKKCTLYLHFFATL